MNEAYDGGCECGQVRYRLSSAPIAVNCCHCRDCQRITGSAFAINAMIETERVELTKGEPAKSSLNRAGAGDTSAWRCGHCGTLLYADHPLMGDGLRFVRAGTLDQAERLTPDAHFFVRSKHPWVVVPAGVPAFDTLPGNGVGVELGTEAKARLAAAMAR
ncbi:MAG: GFA family protein [Pseudolabrys sp.]